ncbi:MAG: M23 family metallopeptidase [Treponema sp.]|jgi:murein DD-endopeptidase MepM/ murein hydrolase activator NlpD|nr:M23 family metallopeptidase [Treponema sp.]
MNHRCGFFSLFLLIAVFSFAEDTEHVVEKGDTVYSISRSFRISPEDLMKYNNITDASKLPIGKRLKIPAAASPNTDATVTSNVTQPASSQPAAWAEYRVVKNDTLYSLARRYGVPLKDLLDKNNFSQNHVLKEGELIRVPADSGVSPAKTTTAAGPPASPAAAGKTPAPPAARAADTSLRWPVTPKEISYMTGKLNGVVLEGVRSESVKSLTQGTVVSAGPYRGFGRVAIVQVTGGYLYVYGGCESLSVKEGDRVGPGTELGKLGVDAVSSKPQLFFLVYRSNVPIDPAKAPRA